MSKTRKQAFLDQEPTSTEMQATQELLRTLNQTQVMNAIRAFKAIDNSLYKSSLKELPFTDIHSCLIAVEGIIKLDKDGSNQMEK